MSGLLRFVFAVLLGSASLYAQTLEVPATPSTANLLTNTVQSPGKAFLLNLDAKFAAAVAKGGGAAYAAGFAEDGVVLENGKAAVATRAEIARASGWLAKDYQLTWTATDGEMAANGDMGYTWGHYDGRSHDTLGNEVVLGGRYVMVWKRVASGDWKVAMRVTADEPPDANGDCCRVPMM